MIPEHNQSGVLPPFLPGSSPAVLGSMSPYRVTFLDVARRYSTSKERFDILNGLILYRDALRQIGIHQGFQWLNGSFVEDTDKTIARSPADIDIITFSYRPPEYIETADWTKLVLSRPDIFNPKKSKEKYFCDAYFVDMTIDPVFLINYTHYWFGLFSHQRETFLWKGMLQIPLTENDADVVDFLEKSKHAS
jgi:hypothetical protein